MEALNRLWGSLGLGGIFLSVMVENLGLPFPIEGSYVLAYLLIQRGFPYPLMVLLLTAAHLTGSMAAYGLGYWGEGYLARRLAGNREFLAARRKLRDWYARYGALTVFATRFIGYVRPWASFVAGFARVNLLSFTFWTALGSLIFNVLLLEFTKYLIYVWQSYVSLHALIALTLVLSFGGLVVWKILRGRKKPEPIPSSEEESRNEM
ncbi:MAG: DedA family protein [Firmicutes bacterium]|nr:DedA family protein [Bacillota bacterium]